MKSGSKTIPLLDPKNGIDFGAKIQKLKRSDIVTHFTVNVPSIIKDCTCGTSPGLFGDFLYTISNVASRETLLTCNEKTKLYAKSQVFHDTIEGCCVSGNDDYCDLHKRLEFYAVETATYIVIVTSYTYSAGNVFTQDYL